MYYIVLLYMALYVMKCMLLFILHIYIYMNIISISIS